ncbi:hypothetical protein B0H14DRAFT_299098 [Mycena olivaceomarginata]|nr:hypothetical protein B0H14DRAFT_299098 [Mycena olivaceomarginata]
MSNASLSSAQTQLLSGTGSTTRSITGARSKCNERSCRSCCLERLPAPGAGFLCAHAGVRYRPRPAAQREHDGHHPPRCAAHAAAVPPSPHTLPVSHVHPQCHTAPLVDDYPRTAANAQHAARQLPIAGACYICRDGTAAGWQRTDHTEAMCTPALPPVPAFHARGLRQARMGHHDKSRRDEPGRRQRNLRCHRISDRTAACAVRISGERCEHGEGYCVNAAEVPIRTRITYASRFFVFPILFCIGYIFTL